MKFLKLLAPLLLFSWGDFGVLEAMKLGNFYPFGESEGDKVVTRNDDGSSGEVSISFPFPFFGQEHDSLFINTNGVISFLTNVYQYTPDRFPLGDRRRLVAPFWADVDTRVAGEVFYRETSDRSLLKRATSDVTTIYVRCKSFKAAWLLIATWYEVAFYGARGNYTSKRNTFQAVLVTNGRNSFVIFNYDKLTWTTGTASSGNSSGLGGTPAQAGFNGGDGLRYFNIPGSGTQQVLDLSRQSNIENPGRWLYRIDSKAGDCDHNANCLYGKIGKTGNCHDPPTPFDEDFLGKPTVTYVTLDPETAAVTLKCEVPINRNIRLWKNVTYQIVWYSEDDHLKREDFCGTLPPDMKEYESPCPGKPLVSFLKGMDYSLNSLISCNVTARYTTSPLNTWCVPKSVQEPFFAGLKVSPNRLKIKECSLDITTLTITPTIPIAASELQRDKYLKIGFWSSDGIEIDSDDCEVELKDLQPITVRVIARCTTTEQSPTVDKRIVPTIEGGHSPFWNRSSHLPSVAVSVETNSENIHTCETYTDPHYRTLPLFDNASGRWGSRSSFAFMEQGDFILYRNSERNFEVHTRLWSCGDSATCNCGVVLRDHNDVIEFSCCNQDLVYSDVTPLVAKLRSKKRLAPGILITQTIPGFNSQYLVTFPSGVKVRIMRNGVGINVLLQTTRARHFANESGLCVISNPRNGNHFRIKAGQSYFDTLPPPVLDTAVDCKVPCACYRKGEEGRTECQRELPVHFPNIMDQGGTPVILTGENNIDGRRKRSIKYTDDLTDEDFELFKLHAGSKRSNRHKRALPPKAKFSKGNATQYCTKRLSDTEIGKLCANLGANLQELVDSCAVDLELTGETAFAISVASLLMNECGEIAGRNLSYYLNASNEEKPEVPSYLTNIIKKLCPNDCTFNGRCVNGSCICNEGYTANDCAIPIYQIPQISRLQGNGLCDRRQRPCRKVTVMGTGFVNSTNITCHITKFKVVNSSWTPNNTEIRLPGTMTDLALTECRLPEIPVMPGHYHEKIEGTPAAGLMISLSNGGEHKSAKNLTFISYDSACLSCNVSTGCVLKGNSCFINRYCFAPNETNPSDLCYQCLPDVSESRWTKRQVNLPPRFAISTQHFALFEELLELVIEVFDPEGMPVNVSLANGSPIEAEMRDNVLIWNVTNNAKTHFFLRATDICQATSSSNISVSLVDCQCRNGSCVPHPNKPRGSGFYACDCVPGFTGDKCETNIDDCRSYPCIRGRCIDGINNFTCICDAGYVGKTCDIDYDDCSSSPCDHGNCSDFTGAYRCSCEPGYGGQNCNIDINECQSSPCIHGTCFDGVNGYNCSCHNGYMGHNCDVAMVGCLSSPCGHGRCIDGNNTFTCTCDPGFVGRTCNIDYDDCSTSPCIHGTCVDLINSYSCSCAVGFNGTNCDKIITSCTNDSCYSNVTCYENNQTISCGPCPPGLTGNGKNCYVLTECQCKNGSCVPNPRRPGSYNCDCFSGFTGDKCETNIDECQSNPCYQGRCIDDINNFTCICSPGYVGRTCDVDYDDCSPFPCVHGHCSDGINKFTCICDAGYVGSTCDVDYDDCSPSPCDHGRCIDSVNNFSCICDAGYVGRTCNIDNDDCSSSHCVHVVPESSIVPSKPTTELVQEGITTDFELVLRVYKEWDDRFRVETSDQFKSLAGVLKNEMLKIYSRVPKFKNVTIVSMRPDELVVVEFKLTFKTKVSVKDALAPLKKKVSSGQLGSLKVDPNSLKLKINSQEKGSSEPQHASKLPIIIGVSCAAFVLIAIPTLCAVFKWNRSVKNSLLPRSNSRVGSGSAMPQEMVFRKVDYKSQATRVKEQKFSLQEKIQLSEVNNGIDF